ncbi:DUF3105 domain-containing protein [Solwaraspora sp. WMMD791]|uniref:DUF3105 domain-containing protein n=1 Tax=Solwaraspora sp. WMMD791 TaxID=3016086 RepID=UPI00249A3234|nr:DUF3105 domain-containing protein [Solwaraspora sp. WMMD791]WFE30256.1 DUF3105 domain-containing protein [Solwaraspora sp. WMMD791]
MSISTQGGDNSRPSVVSTGKPSAGGKPKAANKAGGRPATGTSTSGKAGGAKAGAGAAKATAGRPGTAGKGGKGPRKPVKAVKVSQGRSWGPIALMVAVGVLATGIIGYGAWAVSQEARSWQDRASDITGLINYRDSNPAVLEPMEGKQSHEWGPLEYEIQPPVGSSHNPNWQNCMGDVYTAPIASEHAVHSMEHGAVWVTYRDDLPADQVETLASKVRGNEYTMMSPYEGLESPISLQAWGYQLAVDDANDPRVDEFIRALRQNATVEPQATCSGGITATGTTPRDLGQQEQAMDGAGS